MRPKTECLAACACARGPAVLVGAAGVDMAAKAWGGAGARCLRAGPLAAALPRRLAGSAAGAACLLALLYRGFRLIGLVNLRAFVVLYGAISFGNVGFSVGVHWLAAQWADWKFIHD